MKTKYFKLRNTVYFTSLCLLLIFICLGCVSITNAQKPPTLRKYVDDKTLCKEEPNKSSEYCDFWTIVSDKAKTDDERRAARDSMIEIVRGQVDEFYKSYKDGRRFKTEVLQQIFDILEIGAATTIDFINGERAKSVIAAALTGFKGGRSSFDKNFKVLQMQILINKMNTDRELVLAQIYDKSRTDPGYTWLKAKTDLRIYFFVGTFGNAQDSLNEKTGDDAEAAKAKRIIAEKKAGIKFAPSAAEIKAAATNLATMAAITGEYYKLDADITMEKAKVGGGSPAVIGPKEKRQKEILSQLQTMFGLIEGDPTLQPLLDQVPDKFSNNPASKLVLETSLQKIKDNKNASIGDYDKIFLKVGKLASSQVDQDPTINQRLKTILDTFK